MILVLFQAYSNFSYIKCVLYIMLCFYRMLEIINIYGIIVNFFNRFKIKLTFLIKIKEWILL